MKPGHKLHRGHPAGRDPREMTRDELREAGHEPMSPLQALQARCLDCCGRREGRGPVYRKLGRSVRYRPDDLADFIAASRRIESGWRARKAAA
jgi:hypothetical protein